MNQVRRKWIISAVIYLVLVITGYYIYSFLVGGESYQQHENVNPQNQDEHAGHGEQESTAGEHGDEAGEDEAGHDHGGQDNHLAHTSESEVIPQIHYDGRVMHISFENRAGNPVTEFEITHEKLTHLIIVSEDLEDYRHLHPIPLGDGIFEYHVELPEGKYKAFVDIVPVDYNYHVEPIPLIVGKPVPGLHEDLAPTPVLSHQMNGVKVSLELSAQAIDTPILLTYTIDGAIPEPYLGALGHVVILDQAMNNFIHVHPISSTDTVFETLFTDPGLYKIWGEFQIEGEVYFFPFVIEIK